MRNLFACISFLLCCLLVNTAAAQDKATQASPKTCFTSKVLTVVDDEYANDEPRSFTTPSYKPVPITAFGVTLVTVLTKYWSLQPERAVHILGAIEDTTYMNMSLDARHYRILYRVHVLEGTCPQTAGVVAIVRSAFGGKAVTWPGFVVAIPDEIIPDSCLGKLQDIDTPQSMFTNDRKRIGYGMMWFGSQRILVRLGVYDRLETLTDGRLMAGKPLAAATAVGVIQLPNDTDIRQVSKIPIRLFTKSCPAQGEIDKKVEQEYPIIR
jgi:hypothetical protein